MTVRLSDGFGVERPEVIVPWETDPAEARALLRAAGPHDVTEGYIVARVVSLNGLDHNLGLHFNPSGELAEFELFAVEIGDDYPVAAYRTFQQHLEATFGPPHRSSEPWSHPQIPGGPYRVHQWEVDGCTVQHRVTYRFGPEQHLSIVQGGRPWLEPVHRSSAQAEGVVE